MTDKVIVKQENTTHHNKFGLLDLLMIIMVVGVIVTLVIPVFQSGQHEQLIRSSVPDMRALIAANEAFRADPDNWGDNADNFGDIAQHLDLNVFRWDFDNDWWARTAYSTRSGFRFTINDTSIVATTDKIGRNERAYFFHLFDRRWRVREDSLSEIYSDWLPFN